MLSTQEIARLESFDGNEARVLSAYLDLDPARQVERTYRVAFDDLVDALSEGLEKAARRDLLAEASETRAWLERHAPRGKGLALFSCAARGFWDAYFLPVRVQDHLAFEPRPDVAPLLEVVDEYERYAVALVDKARARLFTVFLGAIEERDEFKDFVPAKTDPGGLAQAQHQRHHEMHVLWHLKRVADHLAHLLRRREFDRLIVAGPEEATSMLRPVLSRPLAARLAAVIPVEVGAGKSEILEKTLAVERDIERAFEERLLADVLETAGGGGRATYGVAPTLEALWIGEVQTLVVAEDLRSPGSECPRCGRLHPAGTATCSFCGAATRPTHDLAHRAVQRALEQAASAEIVHEAASRRLMDAGGGLGARLRYRVDVPAAAGNA
jgi:peptide subunit release factor 1 (eRF1)